MKDVNYDDDTLVFSSFGEVLQVNERETFFYNTMMDIVKTTHIHTFHLQYKNQCSNSPNQVIQKLQEEFLEQWSMRSVRLAIKKNYNNKNDSYKMYYY